MPVPKSGFAHVSMLVVFSVEGFSHSWVMDRSTRRGTVVGAAGDTSLAGSAAS
jgi:hypothetical protein